MSTFSDAPEKTVLCALCALSVHRQGSVHKRLKDIIIHNFRRKLKIISYLCIVNPIKR